MKGFLFNQLTWFLINPGTFEPTALNTQNLYYSLVFPGVSLPGQFFGVNFTPTDLLVVRRIKELPNDSINYWDFNSYIHTIGDQSFNGTINPTISSYFPGLNSWNEIKVSCGPVELRSPGSIGSRIPIEWCASNVVVCFIMRLNKKTSVRLNLNEYFDINYTTGVVQGPYPTLNDDISFKTPLKVDYPLNRQAIACYEAAVNNQPGTKIKVWNFLGYASQPVKGQGIDSGYKAVRSNYDIRFDNRNCTYFTTNQFTVTRGCDVVIVQFNHKKNPGQCRYSSIEIYSSPELSSVWGMVTLEPDVVLTVDYQIFKFKVKSMDQATFVIVERIYSFPAPNYDNCQRMSVFLEK